MTTADIVTKMRIFNVLICTIIQTEHNINPLITSSLQLIHVPVYLYTKLTIAILGDNVLELSLLVTVYYRCT